MNRPDVAAVFLFLVLYLGSGVFLSQFTEEGDEKAAVILLWPLCGLALVIKCIVLAVSGFVNLVKRLGAWKP